MSTIGPAVFDQWYRRRLSARQSSRMTWTIAPDLSSLTQTKMDGHSSFAAVMPMDINQPGVADDLAVAVAIWVDLPPELATDGRVRQRLQSEEQSPDATRLSGINQKLTMRCRSWRGGAEQRGKLPSPQGQADVGAPQHFLGAEHPPSGPKRTRKVLPLLIQRGKTAPH